jgi:hypothetical protein
MVRTCHRSAPDRLANACPAAMGACHPDHPMARAAVTRVAAGLHAWAALFGGWMVHPMGSK